MPSSISSSDARRALIALVAILAVLSIAFESATAVGFSRISRIARRIDTEYHEALRLRHSPVCAPASMLLAGNSLLLEAVDVPSFNQQVEGRFHASRFAVEQTQYLDWYFGLRRLFHSGSRPDIVVLTLNTHHLLASTTRGDYFAHFQMDARDIVGVAKAEKLDTTTASDYLFANWSVWLGGKAEIRKIVLMKLLPNINQFTDRLPGPTPPAPPPDAVQSQAEPRLKALREVCAAYDASLIFVIPPATDPADPSAAVEAAGKRAGVPVLVPYRGGEMPGALYRDGFHLSPEGAKLFTARLASATVSVVPETRKAKIVRP